MASLRFCAFSMLNLKRLSSSLSSKSSPTITTPFPTGYLLTGVHAGVKKKENSLDLALILSTSGRPTAAAACFTRNAFKAAPVLLSEKVLLSNNGRARAIVVNSGCANAVTGAQGLDDASSMGRATDQLLRGVTPASSHAGNLTTESLVMSTGVIGQKLPITKITSAIVSDSTRSSLGSDIDAWTRAATAFMTTDTFPKLLTRPFQIKGIQYHLAGIDKGAGMIHPNMGPPRSPQALHATLLACILTDAPVSPKSLQVALDFAVDRSFNSISVDGDMSTNDTIIVLANGNAAPENEEEIDEATDPDSFRTFREELTALAVDLAKLVVRDGEGATKFVAVTVKGAATYSDAHRVASRISTSALVKTALYGQDANWGRILAATGSVDLSAVLNPHQVDVTFVPSDGSKRLLVLAKGEPEQVDEARAKEILELPDIEIEVDIGMGGDQHATYYTCDLSYEYVRINGDYRS